jgi:beta-lactamase regulating signal transducer with metallopeptidase domain
LTLLWFAGVTFLSLRLACGLFGIAQLRRSGRPLTLCDCLYDWDAKLAELCRSLQIGRNVELLVSRAIDSPVLIGIFRPVVLAPMSFLSGFTPEEVEVILVHELAHVRRHDYLANLVQLLMETLLFYHPLFRYVSQSVSDDREHLCDEFVVRRHGTDSLFYAKTLSRLEQFRQTKGTDMKPTLSTLAAAAQPLLDRIRHILGVPNKSNRSTRGMVGLTLLAILIATPLAFALLQEQHSGQLAVSSEQYSVNSEQLEDTDHCPLTTDH